MMRIQDAGLRITDPRQRLRITLSEDCLASSDNCPGFAVFDIEAAVP
jgi:hypothetical protein